MMLKVENLFVSYGGIEAVKDVSFEVPEGGIVTLSAQTAPVKSTILGPSWGSSGKERAHPFKRRGFVEARSPGHRLPGHHAGSRKAGESFPTSAWRKI
jgi:hypothetical protein